MAKKDLASKKIEDYNEVFADIYNTLLFGKDVLCPDGLRAGATRQRAFEKCWISLLNGRGTCRITKSMSLTLHFWKTK